MKLLVLGGVCHGQKVDDRHLFRVQLFNPRPAPDLSFKGVDLPMVNYPTTTYYRYEVAVDNGRRWAFYSLPSWVAENLCFQRQQQAYCIELYGALHELLDYFTEHFTT